MSATSTLTATNPQSSTATSYLSLTNPPQTQTQRLTPSLNETKLAILSNISSALRRDIDRKREELAVVKTQQHLLNRTPPISTSAEAEAAEKVSSSSPISILTRHPLPSPTPAPPPPYCAYRPPLLLAPSPYRSPSPGRPCTCSIPHAPLSPQLWSSTPAEAEPWDYSLPDGGYVRERKVRFAEDPVEGVRVFERWYVEEYVESGRYWSSGWVRETEDGSSVEDDEWEVECLEAAGGMVGEEGGWGAEGDEEEDDEEDEDDEDEEDEEDEDDEDDGEDEVMEIVRLDRLDLDMVEKGGDGGPLVRMS